MCATIQTLQKSGSDALNQQKLSQVNYCAVQIFEMKYAK